MYPPASMTAASCESVERGGSSAGAPIPPSPLSIADAVAGMGAAMAGATWWWAGAGAGCRAKGVWVSDAEVNAAVDASPSA